ncbi:E3 ubiquitin-protein ligase SGR9, amyloplastic-like [Primulina eburnea]|uniref:E3 ubiquitin-protein ligase SGR9, amyloplastic-like n=1 Tax=Primulina eburnea TaxID=1245227 RepID=UPI003C6C31AC
MMANQTIIMAALSTLSPPQLSDLTNSISAIFRHHHRRQSYLLSSPTLFSLTLRHLRSLSLHHKSLLIARHLLYNLTLLKNSMQGAAAAATPLNSSAPMKLRDLDAVLLLLLLCELHQHDGQQLLETPPSQWRILLCNHVSRKILNLSGFGGFSSFEVLNEYVQIVAKCSNFVNVLGCGGELGKAGTSAAAAAAAVVALPSVEVSAGGECVICKDEIKEGREVCELPCGHYFHWMCILRWLRNKNTCPCCRYRLPTDDARREIDRIFEDLARIGGCFCT